jgi:hypothetical protein
MRNKNFLYGVKEAAPEAQTERFVPLLAVNRLQNVFLDAIEELNVPLSWFFVAIFDNSGTHCSECD